MAIITIPKILREKLSEEGVDALVEVLNKSNNGAKEDVIVIVEERFEKKPAQSEARLIKWMFIFWIGQFASIVGVITAILFAFFRH
ncbi:MAG: hypothetical protein E3K37_16885 [Candidatus Kuenenia sp.]|nr:hypothetical protein [Candidatus Kuenenia hertensis]